MNSTPTMATYCCPMDKAQHNELVRSMLSEKNLFKELWVEAVSQVIDVMNIRPIATLEDRTPEVA